MSLALGLLATFAIVVVVMALTALAIRAIMRNRRRHGTSGALTSAALNVQSLLEPEKRHAVETMEVDEEKKDEDTIAGP